MGLSEQHRVGVVEEEGRSRRRGREVGALSVYRGSWGGGGRGCISTYLQDQGIVN